MPKDSDIPEPRRISPDSLKESWPLYHRNEVALGNLESSLAITTLWTERQGLLKHLRPDEYSAVGQCFSPRGVSLIFRELLANPRITTLAVWGRDGTKTGEMFRTFFEKGFNDDYTLHGFTDAIKLHEEIPTSELENIRKNVKYVDLGHIGSADSRSVAEAVRALPLNGNLWRSYGMQYPLTSVKSDKMPGELIGYDCRGTTIEETWLDILDTILRFGRIKKIPGEDFKLDIDNLRAIVTGDEDYKTLANPEIFKYIPDFEAGVQRYVKQFTSGEPLEGSAYSYGEELFAHRTEGKAINQIDYIVKKLASNPHSGRPFASTWNVGRHMEANEGPCLVGVQFSTIEDREEYRLNIKTRFKTHDMFSAWTSNVLGLRELQKLVLERLQEPFDKRGLNLKLGHLVTVSESAHFYGAQVENAQNTLREFPLQKYRTYELAGKLHQDPRGNYQIAITPENRLRIDHYDVRSGEIVESEEFGNIYGARTWLADKRFSDPTHGIYLGEEIAFGFASINLRQRGINAGYKQDSKKIQIDEK